MILLTPSKADGEHSSNDLHTMMGRQVKAEFQAWADEMQRPYDKDAVIEFMLTYYPEG